MGWGSGSSLLSEIIPSVKRNVKDSKVRSKIYDDMISAFENADCDTIDECIGEDIVFDRTLEKR